MNGTLLALSLFNLLDKCGIDSEEITYPIAASVFNGVEMTHSVILVMADTINDERQSLILPRPNGMQCGSMPGKIVLYNNMIKLLFLDHRSLIKKITQTAVINIVFQRIFYKT